MVQEQETFGEGYFKEVYGDAGAGQPTIANDGSDRWFAFMQSCVGGLSDSRILEIGVGRGGFLTRLLKDGYKAVGTDVSEYAVGEARRLHGQNSCVYANVMDRLPFEEREFSVVVMWHVFEHLPNPGLAISEMRRVLEDGGYLIMATPNENALLRFIQGRKWVGVLDPTHILLYSKFSLSILLERSGFRIAKTDIVFGDRRLPSFVSRALKTILPWGGTELLCCARKIGG